MSIITLTSDYGYKDYYVSAIKAKLLSEISDVHIVDISHEIPPFNVKEGAFVLKNVVHNFPKNTIHFFAVNEGGHNKDSDFFLVKLGDQLVVGTGRGFISALGETPDLIVRLPHAPVTFPAIEVFTGVARELLDGKVPETLGESENVLGFQSDLHLQNDVIIGTVVYTDNYGNLVTNIHHSDFEKTRNHRDFDINFGREHVRSMHKTYLNIEPSEVACIFNSSGFLEIFISLGNAKRLLGLNVGAQVKIDFKNQIPN